MAARRHSARVANQSRSIAPGFRSQTSNGLVWDLAGAESGWSWILSRICSNHNEHPQAGVIHQSNCHRVLNRCIVQVNEVTAG